MATKFLSRIDKPYSVEGPVITITSNRTLKASENNATVIFNSTTALRAQLPAPFPGAKFQFIVGVPASATGHKIGVTTGVVLKSKVSPTGAAIATSSGKGVLNTQATSVAGDGMDVTSDGTNWFGFPTGTWAVEP